VVVDERRNVVAITQTLVALYGSGVTVPGTGVLLNNALNLFDPQPGRPNSIAPGKRPLSNMAHTVVRRGGRNYLAVGAPGGRRIIGTVQQVLLNVLDFGLGIQAACSGPFIDCAGPEMLVSAQIAPETRAELERRGHRFVVVEPSFAPAPFASPTGLLLDPASGLVHGGADPWALGVAAGY
jgi:gamma-glutamyltranspeptidase/glutathione hydrolase